MSSYVISKREYVKAGGFVAGVATELQLWNYDFENNRNMVKEDYYKKFVKFYDMNAESVKEQYGDSERENDPCEYKDDFEAFYAKGKRLAIHKGSDDFHKTVRELSQFFDSACYQTEDEESNAAMRSFFDRLIVEMFEKMRYMELESWGAFELPESKRKEAEMIQII